MSFTLPKSKQETLAKIAHTYDLRFVILHGSYATGQEREDSDLDIAVVPRNHLETERFLSLHHELSALFTSYELDFKTLEKADPLFRFEVVKDGVLLYGDETDYEQYKAVSFRMYVDAKPLFELEKILIKKNQEHLKKHYA